ncbi:MAG: hypothetical protein J0I98_11825 [Mesorhizobium sp.]|nr:hypothetical protein [Mesorhizobium sp.]
MVAEQVELALLEDTFVPADGLRPPFSSRMSSIAQRTGGTLLFDVRVFGDADAERMAAIGYDDLGTALVVLAKSGDVRCAAVADPRMAEHIGALTVWARLPLPEQAAVDHTGTATVLLATLRGVGCADP